MSHEITIGDANVTFEQVEVDLDYNDILENIEDTIYQRISDQIGDEAWDAVAYQVEEVAVEAAQNAIDEGSGNSDHIGEAICDLLQEYTSRKVRGAGLCDMGEAFEEAIRYAGGAGVDDALTVQKRLADLEHKVNTILAGLFDLGERASAVDDRAV